MLLVLSLKWQFVNVFLRGLGIKMSFNHGFHFRVYITYTTKEKCTET